MDTSIPEKEGPIKDILEVCTLLNHELVIMDYGHVLVRRNFMEMRAPRILSGGSPGPHVDYANLVGTGMLTAAILGDSRGAPGAHQILRTIRELLVQSTFGVLIIIPAQPEAFNFNLAYQFAISECLRVKMIVVKDTRLNRKTCGFILIAKIAGAMAEENQIMEDIFNVCNACVKDLTTVFLNNPKKPTAENPYPIYELPIDEVLPMDFFQYETDVSVVLLINASIDLTREEQLVLTRRIFEKYSKHHYRILKLYLGSYCGSKITSVTILKNIDEQILGYLNMHTTAEGWKAFNETNAELFINMRWPSGLENKGYIEIPLKGPKLTMTHAKTLECCVNFICDALISVEHQLTKMDTEYSHGNMGKRLKTVAEVIKKKCSDNKLSLNYPATVFKKLSLIVEIWVSGIIGSIYGAMLNAVGEYFGTFEENVELTPNMWIEAIEAALDTFSRVCSDDKRLTTMYFPLRAFYNILVDEFEKTKRFALSLNMAVYGAEKAVFRTRQPNCMYPDPGAHALGVWLRACVEGVKLKLYPDE